MNDTAKLTFDRVSKRFGPVAALDQVSFEIKRGEVHCIVGENGAGKSTLIKCLSGAYQVDGGRILIDGVPVCINNPQAALELGVAVVYQDLNIVPAMSVVDNIVLGTERRRLGFVERGKNREAVLPYLQTVGLRVGPGTPLEDLSIAQRQMAAIARALYRQAKILVLDEPTAVLSDEETKTLFQIIERLQDDGITIIYISHRLNELYEIGDSVTVLKDGRYVATKDISHITNDRLISLMVGRELRDIYPVRDRSQGEVLLEARGLTNAKINDISFTLRAGEVLGLAGMVSAGRSEILRALMGVDPLYSGEILVDGVKRNIRNPMDAISARIGMVPEDRRGQGIIACLSVRDNITTILSRLKARLGFVRDRINREAAAGYFNSLKIKAASPQQEIGFLSGGNQQKAVLAKWLCARPRILLLDEPTQGIDVGTKAEIYQLIDVLARQGYSIILVSSEMMEILNLSDRILVVREGRIVKELEGKDATEQEILTYAMR